MKISKRDAKAIVGMALDVIVTEHQRLRDELMTGTPPVDPGWEATAEGWRLQCEARQLELSMARTQREHDTAVIEGLREQCARAEQQRDKALNDHAQAITREQAALMRAGDAERDLAELRRKLATGQSINADLQHIERCGYPRWTPDVNPSGIPTECNRPKNHGEVHRNDKQSWLIVNEPQA